MYLCVYLNRVIPGELTQIKQPLYNQNVSISYIHNTCIIQLHGKKANVINIAERKIIFFCLSKKFYVYSVLKIYTLYIVIPFEK